MISNMGTTFKKKKNLKNEDSFQKAEGRTNMAAPTVKKYIFLAAGRNLKRNNEWPVNSKGRIRLNIFVPHHEFKKDSLKTTPGEDSGKGW